MKNLTLPQPVGDNDSIFRDPVSLTSFPIPSPSLNEVRTYLLQGMVEKDVTVDMREGSFRGSEQGHGRREEGRGRAREEERTTGPREELKTKRPRENIPEMAGLY